MSGFFSSPAWHSADAPPGPFPHSCCPCSRAVFSAVPSGASCFQLRSRQVALGLRASGRGVGTGGAAFSEIKSPPAASAEGAPGETGRGDAPGAGEVTPSCRGHPAVPAPFLLTAELPRQRRKPSRKGEFKAHLLSPGGNACVERGVYVCEL